MTIQNWDTRNAPSGRNKALLHDWDAITQAGDSKCLYALSGSQREAILSVIEYLAWERRMLNSPGKETLREFVETLEHALIAGVQNMVYQDGCKLMSCDDGEVIFDFALCKVIPTVTDISNTKIEGDVIIENDNSVYNGDIYNVAPGFDPSGEFSALEIANALCWVLRQYVDYVCNAGVTVLKQTEENKEDWAIFGLGALGAGVSLVAAFLSGGIAIVTAGVVSALLALASTLVPKYEEAGIDDLENEMYRQLIACKMYCNLVGETLTFSNWSNSLLSVTGVPQDMVECVIEANQSEDLFVQYAIQANAAVGLVTDDCGCECDDCENFNFASGSQDWGIDDSRGTWTGSRFQATTDDATGSTLLQISRTWTVARSFESMSAHCQIDFGYWNNSDYPWLNIYIDDVSVYLQDKADYGTEGDQYVNRSWSAVVGSKVTIMLRCGRDDVPPTHYAGFLNLLGVEMC